MEKLTGYLQQYASSLLLVGLFIGAGLGYAHYRADGTDAVIAQEQLVVAVGEVLKGAEVTVQTRGRRGRSTAERYFELTVRPDIGADQKWRVDPQVAKAAVEKIIGRRAQAKLDPAENNLVYVLASEGEFLLTYEQMLKILQGYAQEQKADISTPLIGTFAALLFGLGVVGIWLRRKLDPPDSRDFKNTQID